MNQNNLMPLISVIIPVYNVQDELKRSVDSVINQTYRELEIILIDDGSTDQSGLICDELKGRDIRITVLHKRNAGLSSARNAGIDICSGDYVIFLDSDDWIDIDEIQSLFRTLNEFDAEIAMCGFYITDGVNWTKSAWFRESCCLDKMDAMKELLSNRKITSHAWNKLYQKSLFEGIRFPEGKLYEDIYIMHKLFEKCRKVAIANNYCYYYYQRVNSITGDKSLKSLLEAPVAFTSRYQDMNKKYPEYEEIMLKIITMSVVDALSVYQIRRKEWKENQNKIDEWIKFIRNRRILKHTYPLLTCKQKAKYLSVCYLGVWANMMQKNKMITRLLDKARNIYRKTAGRLKYKGYELNLESQQTNKRIFLIGTVEFDNLGDHAIAYAQCLFFKNYLKEYQIIEITENEYIYNVSRIKNSVKCDDIIALQGGGNIGNVYIEQEQVRNSVIRNFPSNKIVIFPQTIYIESLCNKKYKAVKEFKNNRQITIAARESESYKKMKQIFTNDIILIPDIVMSLRSQNIQSVRKDILMCLRNDKEKKLNTNDLFEIKSQCAKFDEMVFLTDTCIGEQISTKERESRLKEIWREFSAAKLVITDRLHGMIFAAITQTPCVVLGNYNYKIECSYQWLKHLEYITFCKDVRNISYDIKKVIHIENCIYNNENIQKYYLQLAKKFK